LLIRLGILTSITVALGSAWVGPAVVDWVAGFGRSVVVVHEEGSGPLSATSGVGGVSIYPPPPPPWTASFGAMPLCVRKQGEQVRIERVRALVRGRPVRLRHVLRVVPPEAEQRPGFSWDAYYSEAAPFPGNDAKPYGGTLRPVKGAVVEQSCARRKAGDDGYTDLLTELTVDGRGAMVRRTYVDYTSGGRHYTLVVRWEMSACGTAMTQHCGKGAR
jgi:hypothetical protein